MNQQPKYRIYATLLDAFGAYLNSDVIWDKYWGWSENPPHTPEEFHEQQFQELIDRINRKPFDSEAADKGTAFNEVIDCMVENRKSETVQVEKIYKVIREGACDETGKPLYYDEVQTNEVIGLKATYNNRVFTFPISLCREFSGYFKGALTQQRVEAIIPTAYGNVLVYGVIDELMPASVHDIKTTGSYTVGKFKDHHQHLVYPYALMKNGSDVRTFEYNIVEFNKGGYVVDTYTETYVFNPERDIPILTNHCEEFIRFLEENRELITDKRFWRRKLMANQITGRIIEIGQTVQIPSKNGGSSFTKREFILDATTYDPYTGERSEYENVIPLEFSGDKCAELDRFNHGDVVTVSFMIQGRSWTNQDGELKRMASIRCYKIDARGGVSQSQQTTSVQQPAPQSTYQQQPQNFPPPVDVNGNVKDDLPF